MFKKRKEEKKMKNYIEKIYFDNGYMTIEIETTQTLNEITNCYVKSLKRKTFKIISGGENKVNIFNSKNVIGIEIKQLKD